MFDALKFRAGAYDQAVSALIEDIYERGLDKRVLVVVTGEFGRTPKIEHSPAPERATPVPRREQSSPVVTTGRGRSQTSGRAAESPPDASSEPPTRAARTSSPPTPARRLPGHDLPSSGNRPHNGDSRLHRPTDSDRRPWSPDTGAAELNSVFNARGLWGHGTQSTEHMARCIACAAVRDFDGRGLRHPAGRDRPGLSLVAGCESGPG